jgi:agmatine deiminase
VRVDLLLPHEIYARAALVYLGEGWHGHPHVRFLVTATNDIWVRDYGPLTCLDSAGERVVVDPVFDPGLAMPTDDDDAFPARYAAHEGFPSRHLPLRLEGGNLSSDGQGTIIATDRLFAWNRHLHRGAVRERLLEELGAEALIVVPPLRMENTGHVDVFVKLATPDTVLVTEPDSIVNGRRLREAAEVFRVSRNAVGSSYRVVALPGAPSYLNWGIVPVRPNYANALTVNGRVLVPTYRDYERDAAALAVYRQVMPDHEIIPIDARIAANAGGTVHCLTMQIPATAPAADDSRRT